MENKKVNNFNFTFFTVGKTAESTETQEFKKYIGVGSSYVLAVNPTKEELEKIYGREMNAPEYLTEADGVKMARVTFIVKTDPEQCNGAEIINRATITLRNTPAYNRDGSKVQVIDGFGNSTWANTEDAKMGKKLLSSEGKELKIDSKYRMACSGEADLVAFLKAYLVIEDAFEYKNGSWIKKPNADRDCVFGLDNVKDYFKGDFSEIKQVIALQPNNKVKLLYGVRTTEDNKQYQDVCTRNGMVLVNKAGNNAYARLEKDLINAKNSGAFPNTEYKVQELAEYSLEPTNLEAPKDNSEAMPWD